MRSERTRILVEIGLSIALAAVLGLFKLFQLPQSGSVSLEMLPLFVLALRRGLGPGLVAGAIYGVVDMAIEPFVVHPIQFLLDYPIAFAALGLAGVFAATWYRSFGAGRYGLAAAAVVGGVILGSAGRYIAHVVSGYVFFASYAPKGQPVIVYSLVYNSYVWVSAIACIVGALIVLPVLQRVVPVQKGKA